MATLSLDSLTLTDTPPQDLIRAAAIAGFDLCSLWVRSPPLYPRQLLTLQAASDCARLLADFGIEAMSLEFFDLSSEVAVDAWKPALEAGARAGGKVALALNTSNPDHAQVAAALARFHEVAGQFGLRVNFEPVAGAQTARLGPAAVLIRESGVDVGLCVDSHHLIRSGDTMEDLRALDPAMIRYIQICDGPLVQPESIRATEMTCERLYPGDGEFPLRDFLRNLPADVPIAVECPSLRRAGAGVSAADQAREAMAAVRSLLADIGRA